MATVRMRFYAELGDLLAPERRGHDFEHGCPRRGLGQGCDRGSGCAAHGGRSHPGRRRLGRLLQGAAGRRAGSRLPCLRGLRHRSGLARTSPASSTDALRGRRPSGEVGGVPAACRLRHPLSQRLGRRRTGRGCAARPAHHSHPRPRSTDALERHPRLPGAGYQAAARNSPRCSSVSICGVRLDLLSRCSVCNSTVAPVAKEEVREALLPGTRRHYQDFWRCKGCGRVYWQGAHYRSLRGLVDRAEGLLARRRVSSGRRGARR